MFDVNALKPVKGLDKYVRTLYDHHYIFYKRTKKYAKCLCSECGAEYMIRTEGVDDPFEDSCIKTYPVPVRDEETRCPKCKTKALYKPAGVFAAEYHYRYFVVGQKISDEEFVFRVFYSSQRNHKNKPSQYNYYEEKRIYLQKGKKPKRYSRYYQGGKWRECTNGELFGYAVYPPTFKDIQKTGMFKYVPELRDNLKRCYDRDSWVMDFYIAAARYPDMEMILKTGMYKLADNLIRKCAVNFNPRGKTIYDRLRINKNRMRNMIECEGAMGPMMLYQLERRVGASWTDEEAEFVRQMQAYSRGDDCAEILKYASPQKVKNYFEKRGIDFDDKDDYKTRNKKTELRREYYDYIKMRVETGYDMTNSIILFPKNIHQRHNEMVLEKEKTVLDKRKKEVNEKFKNIAENFERISERYSAAAGGLIIRPARDAAEIVSEGRILHHCVGGDNYLGKHNTGKSYILFLRKVKEKEVPYITVEIKDEKILQWYGEYDRKPDEDMIDAWLKEYTNQLKKRNKKARSCTGATKKKGEKIA